jgi:hypothetical protein
MSELLLDARRAATGYAGLVGVPPAEKFRRQIEAG